jgi:tRNA dimethylallyltransferase
MVKEAEKLHKTGVSWKRMEELGLEYRYLAFYLQKKMTKEEMLEQLENKIWQYSKRQMTYWRRNKDIQWFKSADDAYKAVCGR